VGRGLVVSGAAAATGPPGNPGSSNDRARGHPLHTCAAEAAAPVRALVARFALPPWNADAVASQAIAVLRAACSTRGRRAVGPRPAVPAMAAACERIALAMQRAFRFHPGAASELAGAPVIVSIAHAEPGIARPVAGAVLWARIAFTVAEGAMHAGGVVISGERGRRPRGQGREKQAQAQRGERERARAPLLAAPARVAKAVAKLRQE
jgi:hypothetical protein